MHSTLFKQWLFLKHFINNSEDDADVNLSEFAHM